MTENGGHLTSRVLTLATLCSFLALLMLGCGSKVHDLETAIDRGDLAAVKHLVDDDPRLANATYLGDAGWTPLVVAISIRKPNIATYLIAKGADVNREDGQGSTPLTAAAYAGDAGLTELLLAKGARINAVNRWGETALYVAIDEKNYAVARLLRRHGATGVPRIHEAAAEGDIEFLRAQLRKNPKLVSLLDRARKTPLHYAAQHGRTAAAKLLIAAGADCSARDKVNNTPMHYAAWSRTIPLLKLFLAKQECRSKKQLDSALGAAFGDPKMMELLLSYGADVDSKDDLGYTLLLDAAVHLEDAQACPVATILLNHGAQVNARKHDGYTALHLAAVWNKPRLVRLLLDHGANKELRTSDGKTALQLAEKKGSHQAAILLGTHSR